MAISFYSLPFDSLTKLFATHDLVKEGPRILFNWHYKKNRRGLCPNQSLSYKTRAFLENEVTWELPKITKIEMCEDNTVKVLFLLDDGLRVESVLIPFQKKYTVCLSSQAGCAMNCSFCYTGQQGFHRHLKTEEIIGQLLQLQTWLSENRPDDDWISNVVFMGQGEPLHNFDSVKDAAKIMISQYGLSLADHKVTISTAGFLPGLKRWKEEMPEVNIALSLHSTKKEVRDQLIPINKKFDLKEVLDEIDQLPIGRKRFVTFEYLLIKNLNDSQEDARELGQLLKERPAFINLIPFNPIPNSEFQRPSDRVVAEFQKTLEGFEIPAKIRKTKGDSILAACGQLNSLER